MDSVRAEKQAKRALLILLAMLAVLVWLTIHNSIQPIKPQGVLRSDLEEGTCAGCDATPYFETYA